MSTVAPPSFPFPVIDPLDPPEGCEDLQASTPVSRVSLPGGHPAWLVTRLADVRAVLADGRFSREAITAPDAPRVLPIAAGSKSIFVMDAPEHTRLRRLVAQAFSVRRMDALRPRVKELTGRLIDTMVAGGAPGDLMVHLAQPLPITVICELLGVPYTDVDRFRAWTDLMLSFGTRSQAEVIAARDALAAYLGELIAAKRGRAGDDLLTVLVAARDEGDRLSEEELIAFGYTLLGAGYHATTAGIAHAVLVLLREPGRWQQLHEEPSLVPAAVEELLRMSQAGGGVGALRIAVEDVELGGVLIRAGEAVLPWINAANRDPEVFVRPAEYDPRRERNPHLTFGHGIHHCLGAQLGRIELGVAIGALTARLPGLRLSGPGR
ncbi:cytochrome P450 [Pseudonocardia sp. 73-21]|uniref:cytochrome P450 n=1 Tax=Pseudonocardia sp. 73-21 TaxID=1895809 RepID=UPI000A793F54|nr:cytochrome P450 [Pseudonocardia sp. 73-21]